MKKIINNANEFVNDMLKGLYLAYPDKLEYVEGDMHALVKKNRTPGKVGLCLLGIRGLLTWSLSHTGALFSPRAGCSRALPHEHRALQSQRTAAHGRRALASPSQLLFGNCVLRAGVCWLPSAARLCSEPGGTFSSRRRVVLAQLSPEWGPSGPQCPSGCIVS